SGRGKPAFERESALERRARLLELLREPDARHGVVEAPRRLLALEQVVATRRLDAHRRRRERTSLGCTSAGASSDGRSPFAVTSPASAARSAALSARSAA